MAKILSMILILLKDFNNIILSYGLLQDEPSLQSRRKYMTCICSSLVLINVPSAMAASKQRIDADLMNASVATERSVCRNCGGNGAIICEKNLSFFFLGHAGKANFILLWAFCIMKGVKKTVV